MNDKGKIAKRLSQAWAKITKHQTMLMIFVGFVIFAATVFLIVWRWEVFTSEDIYKSGTAFRNFGLPILAVWGIYLAVWRSLTAQKQADTAARSLQNDRYQKGADMLGSEQLSVRAGGINALKRLAQDDPETYHREIMALFSFFAHYPTPDTELEQAASSKGEQDRLRPDLEVIIQAIGQRNAKQQGLDTQGMIYNKDLEKVVLRDVDLHGALLSNANLSWIGVIRSNLTDADLMGTDFTGSDLTSSTLTDANLIEATLTDANLTNAKLISAVLTNADLTNAALTKATLTNADLTNAKLTNATLTNADLTDADLVGADLTNAKLTKATLTNADLTDADLVGADLTNADFTNANLTDANLTNANLARTNLQHANLSGADLKGANLKCANLGDADLHNAKNLTQR